MITINHTNRGKGCLSSRGFSLVELLVVVAILGVLAASVGVYINTADAKLKSFAFNLGTKFKLAKFEAIKRGRDVYVDFDMDGDNDPRNDNGYAIWVNNDRDDPAAYDEWVLADDDDNGNGLCDIDEGDCLIGDPVEFSALGLAIYDGTASGGPTDPKGGPGSDKDIGDGVSILNFEPGNDNRFRFRPSGDGSDGSAYIYSPSGGAGAEKVAAGPWAIIVNNVGRIRLDEWRPKRGWIVDK